jgi:hypothetical protein
VALQLTDDGLVSVEVRRAGCADCPPTEVTLDVYRCLNDIAEQADAMKSAGKTPGAWNAWLVEYFAVLGLTLSQKGAYDLHEMLKSKAGEVKKADGDSPTAG